ncbi:lipocalin family protein [Chryseobacterium vrystaatense]|uniref:Lipocalin-like domain-containing protein n=1 Tax=Chryseobacterium vrystaatense TaxID=307480 RepID=A0A1M4ZZ52_9FLAO|nr:lipocalin family protein [Chryseobacterium vrystaatense]SHF23278.1 Lipocalin-like domain-containing protein [Chryseobacterium vrystaatense]
MKKLFLPLAVLSTMGCSHHNEDPEDDQRTMLGMWKMSKVEVYKSSTKQTEVHLTTGCDAESTHEFRGTDMTTVNYTKNNNDCIPDETVTRKYTYNQKTQKFWYEGEQDYPYIVSQLTAVNMIFESSVEDFDEDGINDVVKYYFLKIK